MNMPAVMDPGQWLVRAGPAGAIQVTYSPHCDTESSSLTPSSSKPFNLTVCPVSRGREPLTKALETWTHPASHSIVSVWRTQAFGFRQPWVQIPGLSLMTHGTHSKLSNFSERLSSSVFCFKFYFSISVLFYIILH